MPSPLALVLTSSVWVYELAAMLGVAYRPTHLTRFLPTDSVVVVVGRWNDHECKQT